MKKYLLALLVWGIVSPVLAQSFDQRTLLHTLCPDAAITTGLHLPAGKGHIRDFRGAPLVLYFYTTQCLACLSTFPKIDSLQRAFAGRVTILLVGRESKAKVAQTFAGRKPLQGLSIAVVAGDTALHRVFRHVAVPHVVLLDASGSVEGITGALEAATLERLVHQNPLHVAEKRDAVDKSPEDPLLYTDWRYEKSWSGIFAATYIARSNPATTTVWGPRRDSAGHLYRWLDIGTVRDLYARIDPRWRGMNSSRVLFDSSLWATVATDTTVYTLDVILRRGATDSVFYEYAAAALDQYFGVQHRSKQASVRSWVLKTAGTPALPRTRAAKWQLDYVGDSLQFTATTWAGFVRLINGIKLIPPVEILDETGLAGKERYDLMLTTHIEDLAAFRASLSVYGVVLSEEEREMNCVILEKKKREPEVPF